ncbi:MAG: hypothetical protein GVY18_19000 [Bacteroidetes bacterium]|nr:hypothetical protein [Bacteroidota bacterium]
MRFLVNNALSPLVAERLRAAGHEATHVRDHSIQDASDDVVIARAAAERRVLISADTDFGTLLALRQKKSPSFILLRHGSRRPSAQADLVLSNLPALSDDLRAGSVVVIEPSRIRVRALPIGGER